jgi:hypothetical protein
VLATYRLEQIAPDRVARTLSAWSVSSSMSIAVLTALWGLLATITSLRVAIAMAGLFLLATPLLLPRHSRAHQVSESSGPVLAVTPGPDPGPGPADPADARVKQVQGAP